MTPLQITLGVLSALVVPLVVLVLVIGRRQISKTRQPDTCEQQANWPPKRQQKRIRGRRLVEGEPDLPPLVLNLNP